MMQRCHYIYDKETRQRVLIPGCMGVAAHYGDDKPLRWCTCGDAKPTPEQRISELEEKIKILENRIAKLENKQ